MSLTAFFKNIMSFSGAKFHKITALETYEASYVGICEKLGPRDRLMLNQKSCDSFQFLEIVHCTLKNSLITRPCRVFLMVVLGTSLYTFQNLAERRLFNRDIIILAPASRLSTNF